MSAQLAQLEEDRSQYQEQLDLVLSSLRDDPDNAELHMLKEELQSALQIIIDSMADMKPKSGTRPSGSTATGQQEQQQMVADQEDGETAAPTSSTSSSAPPAVTFKVNETVLARWVTGDKSFYTARIMSVTGSKAAPMYTVKFKSYDTIETLRARDIRPVGTGGSGGGGGGSNSNSNSNGGKRKQDSVESGSAAPSSLSLPPPPPPPMASSNPLSTSLPPPPPPPTAAAAAATTTGTGTPPPPPFGRPVDRFSSGMISSAAAQLYPQALQEQGKTGGADGSADGPPVKKFKKIKATKQLEAGKSKWQEFNSKSKVGKTMTKKDSMFRTPDGIHGRVGFTGSGQAMRKDPTRSRHIYQTNEDLD
ncbi:hypothetical protein CMQ_1588 [Grosmannia clavigera kw1407]|uniref:Tudor domain-containing protein n=1 Tax=Grosmannia clavigera (strain kw1407 / UAMH 11150) TaxID=655863 RepID=F0XBZ8_GROCL|nr:uncharacterized protein CMQ_1588 [Grosmannia clavigera kw1407]EFX04660.1 hypothetical protein CMQ_1588 [Grosmannia clavigera kw1407]